MGLNEVLKATAEKTPDNTLTPNPYHVVERHRFDFMIDYDHDLRLIAHHMRCLKEIIAEIMTLQGELGHKRSAYFRALREHFMNIQVPLFCRYITTFSAGILNPRPSETRSALIGYFGLLGLIDTIL
jgi:hypothetical protein